MRPDLRRAQGAASREKLLDAATRLFAARGVAATGVDAVAQQAGVAKSALYWHFGSKQGLVAAVVERVGESWLARIRASVEQEGSFEARLDRFVEGIRQLVEQRPELLRLFLAVAVEHAQLEPASRDAVWAVLTRSRDAIVEVLRETLGCELPEAQAIAHLALEISVGIAVEANLAPTGLDLTPRFEGLRRAMAREIRSQMRRLERTPEPDPGRGPRTR